MFVESNTVQCEANCWPGAALRAVGSVKLKLLRIESAHVQLGAIFIGPEVNAKHAHCISALFPISEQKGSSSPKLG